MNVVYPSLIREQRGALRRHTHTSAYRMHSQPTSISGTLNISNCDMPIHYVYIASQRAPTHKPTSLPHSLTTPHNVSLISNCIHKKLIHMHDAITDSQCCTLLMQLRLSVRHMRVHFDKAQFSRHDWKLNLFAYIQPVISINQHTEF